MESDNLKNENNNDTMVLPDCVSKVYNNSKWECCNCGWIGTHKESADKTPVINDLNLLVCPGCEGKEFYKTK